MQACVFTKAKTVAQATMAKRKQIFMLEKWIWCLSCEQAECEFSVPCCRYIYTNFKKLL